MPLSVTCQCGAKLEIDEKFLGKEIPCPDCQRPLPTKAAAVPPPLDLPNHKKTSGLAVLSLTLGLVFLCIPIVGALAAIVPGIFAIKQILKYPSKLDGLNYARAGIALGGVSLFLSIGAFLSPYDFGVSQLLREFAFSSRINYSTDADDFFRSSEVVDAVSIKRPEKSGPWAKWTPPITNTPTPDPDPLLLINTRDDAYISCFKATDVNVDDVESKQKKVIERFFKSELLAVLSKVHGKAAGLEGANVEGKTEKGVREVSFEMRLGRITQRFLILFNEAEKHDIRVVVGAVRRNHFERLESDFRAAFKNVK